MQPFRKIQPRRLSAVAKRVARTACGASGRTPVMVTSDPDITVPSLQDGVVLAPARWLRARGFDVVS